MFASLMYWFSFAMLFGLGLVGLFLPGAMMGMTGIQAPNPIALAEARMMFGGLHLMIAAFLAWAALSRAIPIRTGLMLIAVLFGTMGTIRFPVVLFDGAWSQFHTFGLGLDFGMAALALWARAATSTSLATQTHAESV